MTIFKTLFVTTLMIITTASFAGNSEQLSTHSSAYLISKIGQQNEKESITVVAYANENSGPQFIYLLFFHGGQDGNKTNEEKRALLFSELKNAGLPITGTHGGQVQIKATVVCDLELCSVLVP